MLAQAVERVDACMAKVLKRHKEGVVAIVAPEPLASLVRRSISHGELGDLWKAVGEHGRWEVLDGNPQPVAHDAPVASSQ